MERSVRIVRIRPGGPDFFVCFQHMFDNNGQLESERIFAYKPKVIFDLIPKSIVKDN